MPSGTVPPYGQGTGYGDTSIVTDVSDLLYQITAEDTPFFYLCEDGPANVGNAYNHQWQRRELSTRNDNAQFEGFNFTFTSASRLPVSLFNTEQILAKDIRISGSNQAMGHYAIPNLRADQIEVQLAEEKTDIERALLRSTLNTGGTGTARRMLGIIPMAQSNLTMQTNVSTATFSEARFNGFLEDGWTQGAALRDVLVDGRMKRVISNFTGNAARIIDATAGELVTAIDSYQSEFGPVALHLCRDMLTTGTALTATLGRSVLAVDKTHLKKAYLRGSQVIPAARIADSEDYILLTEVTLEYGHPNSHYLYWGTVSPI